MSDDLTNEITRNCLLTRTRRISRVITGIYDEEYRPFGINAPQCSLLVMISRLGSASRAEIGRQNSSGPLDPDAKPSAHDVERLD